MVAVGEMYQDRNGQVIEVVAARRPGFWTIQYKRPGGHRVTVDEPQLLEYFGPVQAVREAERTFLETETNTVAEAAVAEPDTVLEGPMDEEVVSFGLDEPGLDLRDLDPSLVSVESDFAEYGNGHGPAGDPQVVGPAAVGILALAGRVLRAMVGRGGRITQLHWSRLPAWARGALTQAGIGVGAVIAFTGDIPFVTLPGQGNGSSAAPEVGEHMDIPGVHLGAHVVGSWVANGVTFYRLSDGKLAVMNKHGRWKVWRPKKPIVIMPSGAINLRTLLRADKVLNRQAKQLASMLNRRAPRARKAAPKAQKMLVPGHNGGMSIINVD